MKPFSVSYNNFAGYLYKFSCVSTFLKYSLVHVAALDSLMKVYEVANFQRSSYTSGMSNIKDRNWQTNAIA